jgi:hypothetical protein
MWSIVMLPESEEIIFTVYYEFMVGILTGVDSQKGKTSKRRDWRVGGVEKNRFCF